MRLAFSCSVLLLALASSGCNARSAMTPPAANAPSSASPIVMAQGGDCRSVIARYRAVVQSDVETGNANKSVGAQIDREIGAADGACAAGRESEALRLIASSKARHGYPSGN